LTHGQSEPFRQRRLGLSHDSDKNDGGRFDRVNANSVEHGPFQAAWTFVPARCSGGNRRKAGSVRLRYFGRLDA
jgi:hypothetical protein